MLHRTKEGVTKPKMNDALPGTIYLFPVGVRFKELDRMAGQAPPPPATSAISPRAPVFSMQRPAPVAGGLQAWLSRGSSVTPPPYSPFHPAGVRAHAVTLALCVHDVM